MSEIPGVLVGLDSAEIDRHSNSRIGSNRKPVKTASRNFVEKRNLSYCRQRTVLLMVQ